MKSEEDEAFDDLAKKQGDWGGGFPAKRAMAMDKVQEYDQTALELCNVCGWKTLIPDDGCLNCERAQPAQEPEREALKMALEALENKSLLTPNEWKAVYGKAITDIKQALAAPVQEPVAREWNFCERCGKRTADLTVIHTCTPPQEKSND